MPYQPGTIRRRGKPCCGSSGAPFMAHTSKTSSPSACLALQAAAIGVLLPAVEAAVGADEGDLRRILAQARALEHMPQRRAGPFRSAHGLVAPGHARVARGHDAAAVAGALECHAQRAGRQPLDVVEGDLGRPLHAADHLHLPIAALDIGHVEMIEQIVHPDRRHVVAQGLQQDAGVAVGEGDLVGVERPLGVGATFGVGERISGRHVVHALGSGCGGSPV